MKNKVFEICHLCGKEAELSYEHIPPQSSFNKLKAKTYTMEQMMGRDALPWDISELRYKQNQRGAGKYSLCKKCNNETEGMNEAIRIIDGVPLNNEQLEKVKVLFMSFKEDNKGVL